MCSTELVEGGTTIFATRVGVQGGEDPWDALSCRLFFAKEPPIIGLFCGKCPTQIRHPMGLRHPVVRECVCACVLVKMCI